MQTTTVHSISKKELIIYEIHSQTLQKWVLRSFTLLFGHLINIKIDLLSQGINVVTGNPSPPPPPSVAVCIRTIELPSPRQVWRSETTDEDDPEGKV